MSTKALNVLAVIKGGERFIFLWDDSSDKQLLHTLGKYAADPSLSFTWEDAAILSRKFRKLREPKT